MSLVDLGKKLLEASRQGLEEEVKILMASGAPFTTDWLGTSPLHLAAHAGHISTAEVLLIAGVSRDARTKVDRTPLHLSAQQGHIEIVRLLLQHGADINATDMLKMTPLHWAVERSHPPVVRILLENGADCHSINKFEKTPMDIAIDHQNQPIIDLLEAVQGFTDEVAVEEAPCIYITTTDHNPSSVIFTHTPATTTLQSFVTAAAKAKSKADQKVGTKIPTTASSTSVLATLAALAEASAPLNKSTSDYSRSNSLYGLSGESLQTFTLTEAGKLALNWKKCSNSENKTQVIDSTDTSQKVITIVHTNERQPDITCTSNNISSIHPTCTTSIQPVSASDSTSVTLTLVGGGLQEIQTSKSNEDDTLHQQLQEAQEQAEKYKQKLAAKEREAENYRKKLQEISGSKHIQNT